MATAQTQTNVVKIKQFYKNQRALPSDQSQQGELSVAKDAELLKNLYGSNAQIIDGLDVSESSTPGMTVDIAAGIAKHGGDGIMFQTLSDTAETFEDVDTSTWQVDGLPVILDAALTNLQVDASHATLDRIDIVEIRLTEADSDQESRDIIDPVTKSISSQLKYTRRQLAVEAKVTTGTAASTPTAPSRTAGWIKIAEIHVGAAVTQILDANIYNVTARLSTENNNDWTNEVASTFKTANIQSHREAATIDHPDNSVTWAKLSNDVRANITGGAFAEVFWGEVIWVSTSNITIFPDRDLGVIRAILNDGSVLDRTTPIEINLGTAANRLDGLSLLTNAWYSIILYKDATTGNLEAKFWALPTDTISSASSGGAINLNGTNAFGFTEGMQVVLFKNSNNFDSPFYHISSGTPSRTVNASNDLVVTVDPSTNNALQLTDRSSGIGINTTYSGSDVIYGVSGFVPVKYSDGSYPTEFDSSTAWADSKWRIRTDGSGNIIQFQIHADIFYWVGANYGTINDTGTVRNITYVPVDKEVAFVLANIQTYTNETYSVLETEYYNNVPRILITGGASGAYVLRGAQLTLRCLHQLHYINAITARGSIDFIGYKR